MTAHTFQSFPSEAHNDKSFYFCGTCNAAKIVKTPTPNGPYGPYVIPIDADKFTTCELAFAEAERQKAEDAQRVQERQVEREERQERAAAFWVNHAEGKFYWVRADGELTIAKLFRDAAEGLPVWHCLVRLLDDDDDYAHPPFDAVKVVSGPLEEPTGPDWETYAKMKNITTGL